MHGRDEDTAFNHWSNSAVLALSLPSHCCLSLCWYYMQANSISWAYHFITLLTANIPPLSSALRTQGIDLVWRWGITHSSLDHTLCLMLIGLARVTLARPKKVSATVKLCLWGGDCEAKCLRLFSHAKSYRVSFRFTPKLSDQVVVKTEESNFLYSLLKK